MRAYTQCHGRSRIGRPRSGRYRPADLCTPTCQHIHICAYIYRKMCVRTHACMYMYVYTRTCKCVHVHTHACTRILTSCTCTYVHTICICACARACIFINLYIYTYIHIHDSKIKNIWDSRWTHHGIQPARAGPADIYAEACMHIDRPIRRSTGRAPRAVRVHTYSAAPASPRQAGQPSRGHTSCGPAPCPEAGPALDQ